VLIAFAVLPNCLLADLPSKVIAAIHTTATRATSRMYSTSEAPSSSRMNVMNAGRIELIIVVAFTPHSAAAAPQGAPRGPVVVITSTRARCARYCLIVLAASSNFPFDDFPRNVIAEIETTAIKATRRMYSTSEAPASSAIHDPIVRTTHCANSIHLLSAYVVSGEPVSPEGDDVVSRPSFTNGMAISSL
jgi:hypothetical protein